MQFSKPPSLSRSYDLPYLSNRKEVYRGGYAHYMWEGLRASTAAPSYFREVAIGGDVHIDGALLYNNPAGRYLVLGGALLYNNPTGGYLVLGGVTVKTN